jgi:outer membrane protein, heavy metal efflux system
MRRLLLSTILLAAPLLAQNGLTLEDAVSRALASHPELAAGRQRVGVSEGLRRQVGMRPNPSFTFQQENIRNAPGDISYWSWTDTFAFVSQTIETGKKRQRRVESASTDIERATLDQELAAVTIASNVRQAYWAAAGAQRIYELFLESAKNFLLTVQYHEVRVREGAMAEADLLRIRLESERLNLARNVAFLEAERARINLFRQMGQAEIPTSVEFDPLNAPEDEKVNGDTQLALEQRAEMKIGRLAVRQSDALLNLARANKNPDVSALAGYKRSAGYNSLVAGVTVDLPVFDRNQGEIAAATSQIAASRAELATTAAVVRAEVEAARRDYEIRRMQILESLQPMRDQAKQSSDIAQAAYREGGWDLLRLLDAETMRIEIETLYYRALAEYRQSVAGLNTAMGVK